MLPTLSIGPLALPTYPFSILVALWAGMWLAARRADRLGIDGDHAYNAGLYGLITAIVGARLWFVLSHWENYAGDITQAFSLSRGALSVPEGLLLAGLVVLVYLQRQQVPLAVFADAVAPALALALSIISVGAFLGGVNLGAPTEVAWAVDVAGTARHPVQLYQAAVNLAIFAALWRLAYRPWPGFQFWLFVALYATGRLLLEIFVARPATIADGLLTVQLFSLAANVVSLAVMAYNFTHLATETVSDEI
ncbi:MAG: prolipoprotein diacylglyceryl transferase [Anaerolineae bacterium]